MREEDPIGRSQEGMLGGPRSSGDHTPLSVLQSSGASLFSLRANPFLRDNSLSFDIFLVGISHDRSMSHS